MAARHRSLLAILVVWLATSAARGQSSFDEAVPLQRLELPAARVPLELEKARSGMLVQLPYAELQAQLARARAAWSRAQPPRVARAAYTAEFDGQALVQGRGQWTFNHSGLAPALAPLAPLNLALDQAKWDHGADALIAEFDSKTPALLVPKEGSAVCKFDWSLRGASGAHGVQFELQLPPCPRTSLELTLPADWWLSVARESEVLRTGPLNSDSPKKKVWRIEKAGAGTIALVLRPVAAPGAARLLGQVNSRQVIQPGRSLVDFEVAVDAPRAHPRELHLEGDAALHPYEVTSPRGEVLGWEWRETPGSKKTHLLTVRLREPLAKPLKGLQIRCLHTPADPTPWTSPSLRLVDAVIQNEALQIQVHPDLQQGRWDLGDFRLIGVSTDADGQQTFNLVNPANDAAPARRPSFPLRQGAAELRVKERTSWQLEPYGTGLVSELTFDPARGQLHQLVVNLPKSELAYQLESVEVVPAELSRSWVQAGPVLLVDLQRAIDPRTAVVLRLKLRSSLDLVQGRLQNLEIPHLGLPQATLREGSFQIEVAPGLNAALLSANPQPAPGRKPTTPGFSFFVREQPVQGRVALELQPSKMRVRASQEIRLTGRQGTWTANLEVQPIVGQPDELDLYLSAPLSGPLRFGGKSSATAVWRVQRQWGEEIAPHLLGLGANHPWSRAALHVGLPRGQRWRLSFGERLRERTTLTLQGDLEPVQAATQGSMRLLLGLAEPWALPMLLAYDAQGAGEGRHDWRIPLLSTPEAGEFQSEVQVFGAEVAETQITARGVESPRLAPNAPNLLYTANLRDVFAELALTTRVRKAAEVKEAFCDDALLTTHFETGLPLRHALSFRLWHWKQPRCAVVLPPDAEVDAVRVNGTWLRQLDRTTTPTGVRLEFAVPLQERTLALELDYRTDRSSRACPAIVMVPGGLPELPAPVGQIRQRWRLAPGWVPLFQESMRLSGDPVELTESSTVFAPLLRLWKLGEHWNLFPWNEKARQALEAHKQRIYGAESVMRGKLPARGSLGDALSRLQAELPDIPLVVDNLALERAGLHARTALPEADQRAFWESLGMVVVPAHHAALLTTSDRATRWRRRHGDRWVELLHRVVTQASVTGVDQGNAFLSLPAWLSRPSAQHAAPSLGVSEDRFTDWELLAGLAAPPSMWFISEWAWQQVGWAGAALIAAVGLLTLRHARPAVCLRGHLIFFTGLAFVALGLPVTLRELVAWPWLAAQALVCVAFFSRVRATDRGRPARSTMIRTRLSQSSMLVLAALLAVSPWSHARQASEPYSILLIPSDRPEGPLALVAPDLLRKLDEIERRPSALLGSPAVTRAKYSGRIRGDRAEFDAQFELYQGAAAGELILPLQGVVLKEGVQLDGAPVFPTAVKAGYRIPIAKAGVHQLRLSFHAAIAGAENAEVRFGIPRAPLSAVELNWASPVLHPHLVQCHGAEQAPLDPRRRPLELRASLGSESQMVVRWQTQAEALVNKNLEARELHYWDFKPGVPAATALYDLTIAKTAHGRLIFQVPEGLEVQDVRLFCEGAALPLKRWSVSGQEPMRLLLLEFQQPVLGRLICKVELQPRLGRGGAPIPVALPTLLGVKSTETSVAYRMEGADTAEQPRNIAVTNLPLERFVENWERSRGGGAPAPNRAYRFVRTGPSPALVVSVVPPRVTHESQSVWTLHPKYADFTMTSTLNSGAEDLLLLEAKLPQDMILADVNGPHVHHWTLAGDHLQIWLDRPCRQTSLEMTGWVKLPADHRWSPRTPTLHGARAVSQVLQIRPESSWRVMPLALRGLAPMEEPLAYRATAERFDASFQLLPHLQTVEARALTSLAAQDDAIRYQCVLALIPHDLEVRLTVSGWVGEPLRLETPVGTRRLLHQRRDGEERWSIQLPKGLASPVLVTLSGRASMRASEACPVPHVRLDGGELGEHVLALKGVSFTSAALPGAVPLKGVSDELAAALKLAPADVQLWKGFTPARVWSVALPPREDLPPVRVLLAEHYARCIEPTRWLHSATYFVFPQGQRDFDVKLPAGAVLLSTRIDNEMALPAGVAREYYRLRLPSREQLCLVHLQWHYPSARETVERPQPGQPQLPGTEVLAVTTRFELPQGYRWRAREAQLATLAHDFFEQALVYQRLTAMLKQRETPGRSVHAALVQTQQQFFANLRQLEAAVDEQATWIAESELQLWRQKIAQLRRENLEFTSKAKLERIRNAAENRLAGIAPIHLEARQGLAVRADMTEELPAHSALAEEAFEKQQTAEVVVLAAVLVLLLSHLRRGPKVLRALWPEAAMLFLAYAIFYLGLTPVALLLLAFALAMRVLWLARAAADFWHARVVPTPSASE